MKLIKPFYQIIDVTIITNVPDYEIVERDFKDYEKDLQTVNLTFHSDQEIYWDDLGDRWYDVHKYTIDPHSRVQNDDSNKAYYVTTYYGLIRKNRWFDDLQYVDRLSEFHEKRISIKFSCNSFILEKLIKLSQEFKMMCHILPIYCSNEQIEHIIPSWMNISEGEWYCSNVWSEEFPYKTTDHIRREYWGFKHNEGILEYSDESENDKEVQVADFLHAIMDAEYHFYNLIKAGFTHEQASCVLPNSVKREIILTGYQWEWGKMLDKNTDLQVHDFIKKPNIELFYAPR